MEKNIKDSVATHCIVCNGCGLCRTNALCPNFGDLDLSHGTKAGTHPTGTFSVLI